MSNLFFRNPRLTMLALGLIFVAGASSYYVLPRMEDPILTARFANINTVFPGAVAERVESLVSERLEDALLEIDEINEVRSISRAGFSSLSVELRDDIYEVDEIWSRIRDKVDDAALAFPEGALEPVFEEQKVKAYALLLAVQWSIYEKNKPLAGNRAILRRLAEDVADRLRSVPGTEVVDVFGDPDEEITVEINQSEAVALGLSPEQIALQLANSDSKITAGQLRGRSNLPLEVDTELDSIARIGQTPIQFGTEGDFVRLADIAEVRKDIRMPPNSLVIADGKLSVVLGAMVREDVRVDHWFDNAKTVVVNAKADMPQGVDLSAIFDQNTYVRTRLSDLLTNLLLGALAVTIVIFVMMGWRSAIVVGAALPLSAMLVLTGMRVLEIPIHQMSVTGLIIALGLLIDNAIVMVDEVSLRLREGDSPAAAVSNSVRMLAIPLFGSTLTTALSFGPIALMPGPAGEFVGAIAINVILAVSSSFLLALTVVPAIAAFARSFKSKSNGWWEHGFHSKRLSNWYRQSLPFLIAKPWRGILLSIALPVFGFVQARHLPEQFFPPADRDQFRIQFELPAHASILETAEYTTRMRETLLAEPEVKAVSWFLGESAAAFYYNMVANRENQASYGEALVQLHSADGLSDVIRKVQTKLDREYPEARVLARQLEQGPPFEAPVEVRLFGPDPDVLRELGDEVRLQLSQVPHVVHTRSDLSDSLPKLSFHADEEQVRLVGLSNADIARQMQATFEGTIGGSILETTEELPVRVRVADAARASVEPIYSTMLNSPRGGPGQPGVPLSALGRLELESEYGSLIHLRGRRMNEVQAYVEAGVLPATVLTAFQERLTQADFELPPGYKLTYGGEAAERDGAVGNLMANVGVLVVLMIATLVLSFGSFRIAGLIGVVAMLSTGLGVGSLWVFGFPFGFMAIVGTMGLVGLAINDSIVVLAALREHEQAAMGEPNAVCDVVHRSTPHVVATSVTTVAGFLPLIIAGGGFWPPLAVTIAGGVGGATLLALYFVPSAWVWLKHRSQ
jgi:multidrug efflux pump subunit AcrB